MRHMTHMHHEPTSGAGAVTVLAFIAGAAAGVAAGILYAPKGGQETREQLKGKLQDARTKGMEQMHKHKEMTRKRVAEMADQAKEGADALTDRAQEVTNQGREAAEEAKARVRRTAREQANQ